MAYIMTLDDEQMDILRHCLTIPTSFLNARIKRADPDGMISAAMALQENKIRNMLTQAEFGPIPTWEHLSKPHRRQMADFIAGFMEHPGDSERSIIITEMVALLLRARRPETDIATPTETEAEQPS